VNESIPAWKSGHLADGVRYVSKRQSIRNVCPDIRVDSVVASGAHDRSQAWASQDRIRQTMRAERISFAEAIRRPRNMMVGTPAMIADSMQDMFETEACDGFVLTPTISPVMWEEFARMLTPELQRRGLLRSEYTGATMRENLRS
jgi:alkanesulfonate monooxygenase SsuD/methylene tetrahydromethanopterin reductase-like flavin-dependent oxidoreductase (luciferase family)